MAAGKKRDFYQTLGVQEKAAPDEIKKAYRSLAKKFHPDVTGGDKAKEARFKEVSEAYETLGDEKKRAAYDEARKNPFAGMGGMPRGGQGNPFRGGGGPRGNVDLNDLFQRSGGGAAPGAGGFGDLFSELFSGGAAARAAPRGADLHAKLEVELQVAALGGEVPIVVDGKRWNVKVPPGIDEGQTIRLAGKGQPGRAGPGDLLLELHVRPHAQLRRNGADLEVDVPISIEQAVIGGKADVTTLEGHVQLTVPAGTSSGVKMRLRGKGVPKKDGSRGDLYAVAQIVLPKEIPPSAKELIVEFAKLTAKK